MMYFYSGGDDVPGNNGAEIGENNGPNTEEELQEGEGEGQESQQDSLSDRIDDAKDLKDKLTKTSDEMDQQKNAGSNKDASNSGNSSEPNSKSGPDSKGNEPGGNKPGPESKPNSGDLAKEGAKEGTKEAEKKAAEEGIKKGGEVAAKEGGKAAASSASAAAATEGAAAAGGAASTAGGGGLIGFFATPPGWITLLVILAIIVITGTVFFFVGMPGLVGEKLKQLGQNILDSLQNLLQGSEENIKTEEIASVANYLESMGYDLKGEGFISSDKTESDRNHTLKTENGDEIPVEDQVLDSKEGVIRYKDTGEVLDLNSDPIFTYIVSDNLCYMIKNFNQNLEEASHDFWFWVGAIVAAAVAVIAAIVLSPIAALGVAACAALAFATASNPNWGTGLISIYHQDGNTIGKKGKAYDVKERGGIELDTKTKKMKIQRGWSNNSFTYDVDGWGGQYGMPLEFLLSVHIATQMPDLTMKMATAFDTDLQVLLKPVDDGDVQAGYNVDGNYINYDDVKECVSEWFGTQLDKDGANKMIELGFNHKDGEPCSYCEVDDNGKITKLGDECKDYLLEIANALQEIDDDDSDSYTPYIAKVTNHWYRDVYFVINDDSEEVIQVDENYFHDTGERWTEYEEYTQEDANANKIPEGFAVGDYKLFFYKDGEYEPCTLSKAKVDEINEKISKGDTDVSRPIKKTITKTLDVGWSAYAFDPAGDSYTDWIEYKVKDDEDTPDDLKPFVLEEGEEPVLYYRQTRPDDIKQVEDGQRGETNPDIKDMFVNEIYYQYDGTVERANKINANREIAYTTEGEGEDAKAVFNEDKLDKSLVGKVAISKDSLTAFSMLENTHTLDADYAYKNFKELIVELNYFDKEDLSDKIQEVMQWPIPECASGGWPLRYYEKGETYYGTLINSEKDVELLQKKATLKQQEIAEGEPGAGKPAVDTEEADLHRNNVLRNMLAQSPAQCTINHKLSSRNVNIDYAVGKKKEFLATGTDISDTKYTWTPTGKTGKVEKTGDLDFGGVQYETWFQGQDTCVLYSAAFMLQVYTDKSFEENITSTSGTIIVESYVGGYNDYWVDNGAGGGYCAENIARDLDADIVNPGDQFNLINEALSKGIPVWFYSNYQSSSGTHAIVLLGKSNGNLVYYNPWGGVIVEATDCGSNFLEQLQTVCNDGFIQAIIPKEPPKGSAKKSGGASFVGYKPEQEVVAPITGKIVDIGIPGNAKYPGVTRRNIETGEDEEVGYIKIQAMDRIIRKEIDNSEAYKEGYSNASIDKSYDEYMEENPNDDRKMKEGYDYFFEEYQGVCDGFVLYMEGIDITLFEDEGAITMADNGSSLEDMASLSKYTPNEVKNMENDTKEAQYLWREDAKAAAAPILKLKDADGIDSYYIKEGTVIGKTMGSQYGEETENAEDEAYDDDTTTTTTETTSEEPTSSEDIKPNGNYMRLIFRDLEDTVVEDIENYIPTEDAGKTTSEPVEYEKFLYMMGCIEEGVLSGSSQPEEDATSYIAHDISDGMVSLAFGLTDSTIEGLTFGQHVPKKEAMDIYVKFVNSQIEKYKEKYKNAVGEEPDEWTLYAIVDKGHFGEAHSDALLDDIANWKKGTHQLSKDDFYFGHDGEGVANRTMNEYLMVTKPGDDRYFDCWQSKVLEFKTETPWTDFYNGGGHSSLISDGSIHTVGKDVDVSYENN